MAIRTILTYPDPRLRAPAAEVAAFDATLRALSGDLLETLQAANGIGITAPHIGVAQRVVVLALPGDAVRVYVNPRVTAASSEMALGAEGSVSMPGMQEQVERHARVDVVYRDLDGAPRTETASGLLGICLQHEIDQLDGMFWIQRLSRLKRTMLIKRFDKLRSGRR